MRTVHATRVEVRQCQRGQGVVEAALTFVLVTVLIGMAVTVAWWAHAQNVVTAAVQDGARAASAFDGNTARDVAIARQLLRAGLGRSADLVELRVTEDSESVTFTARGRWPVVAGPGVEVNLPLAAEARVLKDQWRP
jgi:Flp pilus assembly protein TadG